MLDPGVLISALISSKGTPRELMECWLSGMFELMVCPALLDELERVLLRRKFRPYVNPVEVRVFVALFRNLAELHSDPAAAQPGLTPDPGDDYLVALARQAGVHFLVSGDVHLLRLKTPRPPVLTPKALLELIERQ